MWYREAQRGIMNLDRLFPGAEQAITSWIKEWTTQVPEGLVFEKNVEVPKFLKKYVSSISHDLMPGNLGQFNPETKTLHLPEIVPANQEYNLISTVLHEIRHAIDPKNNNKQIKDKFYQQYNVPNAIVKYIESIRNSTNKIPNYEELITVILKHKDLDPNDILSRERFKQVFPESAYNIAIKAINENFNLYLNDPTEHSSQLGDVARLLGKKNLDALREYIKKNQKVNYSDDQLRLFLKNGLNPNNRNFEPFSQIIQIVSGNRGKSLSDIVKGTKDPNWQKQYLKQVSDAVSVYNTDGNRFLGLVRRENRVMPGVKSNPKFNLEDNANTMKSRAAFFSKAAQLEALAESNPKAWSRFIKFPMVSRMIPKNLSSIFKNIGTGSKSLSQSLRQMPPQSPLWGLLEPALEFGLYQFGLYLENPSAFSLETPEQKLIKDLNARINEIIANPKITDKRGYFIKNYGSSLKTLGSMEQNELLGKFPIMGFSNFMNIGRNIRQK